LFHQRSLKLMTSRQISHKTTYKCNLVHKSLSFKSLDKEDNQLAPDSNVVYFWRITLITHSMWILRFASFLVVWTSVAKSWLVPLVNAGIFTSAHIILTPSCTSKPQSASRISPGKSLLSRPQFQLNVCYWSSSPNCRYERVCSSWTTANQELYWVVTLVQRPGLCLS